MVDVLELGFRLVVMVGVVGLEFSGMLMVDMVGGRGVLMVETFGLWFEGVAMVDSDKPIFGDSAKGVVAVASVEGGLSGVFSDGVLVSVFIVIVVMVSEATSGPVERGGGETDTVFVTGSGDREDFFRRCQRRWTSCVAPLCALAGCPMRMRRACRMRE